MSSISNNNELHAAAARFLKVMHCLFARQKRRVSPIHRSRFPRSRLGRNAASGFFDGLPALLVLIVFGGDLIAAEPPVRDDFVSIDRVVVHESCDLWNRAVRAAHGKQWKELNTILAPTERSRWDGTIPSDINSKAVDRLSVLAMFPLEVDPNDAMVLCYRDGDGRLMSRIYGEQSKEYPFTGGRVGTRRFILGTILRERDGSQLLHVCKTGGFKFGLGESIAGIRLDARVKSEFVESWDELELVVNLVNTTVSESIAMQSRPSLDLYQNVSIGLVEADSPENYDGFIEWSATKGMLNAAARPVPPLIRSAALSHKVQVLGPGEVQEFSIRLRAGDSAAGPMGRFRIVVEYDPNLEPDPFEAALRCWRHRVASRAFGVTVGRRAASER